ncbi:TonB protein C-terminal [Bryocella elongata]|uniref:TonB protein C-terminal n=1 Tax=Bryocella elongata TaxID=863522 RepID=A0A1H6BMP3_9BACT|nr:energy transducer TonB [Bryocella elongata]SEG61978.1 TonB protein C-terminal [Bryocella elongata]
MTQHKRDRPAGARVKLIMAALTSAILLLAASPAPAQQSGPNQVLFGGKLIDGIGSDIQRVTPLAAGRLAVSHPSPIFPPTAKLTSGALVKVLIEVDEKGTVSNILGVDGPADLTSNASSAVQTWTFRPYIHAGKATPIVTTIPLLFQPAQGSSPAQVLYVPSTIRISGGVLAGLNEHKVIPQRITGAVSGTVVLQVLVDPHGYVAAATATSGPLALHAACEDAVMQWRYQPYLLNGEPTWVESTVVIRYNVGTPQ